MNVHLLHTDAVRLVPPFPLEIVAAIDDNIQRVEIEWSSLEQFVGTSPVTADAVGDFLRANRRAIEIAIEAAVFAHGLPLAGQLVLAHEDLDRLLPIRPNPAARPASTRPAAG